MNPPALSADRHFCAMLEAVCPRPTSGGVTVRADQKAGGEFRAGPGRARAVAVSPRSTCASARGSTARSAARTRRRRGGAGART